MIMAIPVTIVDFKAPALMTFEYNIDQEEVASAVPAVEAVEARPAQDDLPEQTARVAIESRPKVLIQTFQRSIRDYHGTPVKFE